jgi:hypothetical protein
MRFTYKFRKRIGLKTLSRQLKNTRKESLDKNGARTMIRAN